jgi:heavy-metal-associated domain-containing protein
MSPVSILPGRIRFESLCLVGKERECRHLAECIRSSEGVNEASVNHRTGRVLVTFDEAVISRERLSLQISALMKSSPEDMPVLPPTSGIEKSEASAGSVVRHVLIDAAAHVLLPRPLNILFPMAMNSILK